MPGRKRVAVSSSSGFDADSNLPPSKKHGVTTKTVDKWIADNDKTLNKTTWLKYDKADREHVATLKCSVCFRFNDKLLSTRNYNPDYVVGSTNLRTSAFKEHTSAFKEHAASFMNTALQNLCARLEIPLQKAQVDIALLEEEWEDTAEYAKRYLNIVQEDYRMIWWKLYNLVNSKKWANILSLVELLFCLPMANGHVEGLFSSLKLIKTDRRSCLSEDHVHLDHRVSITVDGAPLTEWNASAAMQLWWKDKCCRQVADTRAAPKRKASSSQDDSSESEPYTISIYDWESFLA